MATGFVIKKNRYFDSVFLMQVAQNIQKEPGIQQAAALMGTEKNKHLLADMGFAGAEIVSVTSDDLIIAVQGTNPKGISSVLDHVNEWLVRRPSLVNALALHTLEEALSRQPQSNLAVISVPGEYAGKEARRALECGLNVFLFSSNVPVEEEILLKGYAREHGLSVMGPDCGTAIIAGVGIGFANAVRRGSIGVIGPSGTGLQEFTSTVHHLGSGISHAIGIGSRDLSDAVGGISALQALDALEADPTTAVIGLVSKPPGTRTLERLIERANRCSKPVVACFLGVTQYPSGKKIRFTIARTLDEAAAVAVGLATGQTPADTHIRPEELQTRVAEERNGMQPRQRYMRGIFAGGTFCYQAQQVMQDGNVVVHSNAPLEGMSQLADPRCSVEHSLVDMGAEFFTEGRPHPMIDSTLRRERILAESQDPQVAVLLVDFILGYNASPNPVGDLLGALIEARRNASQRGAYLSIVTSVCGTDDDPQNYQSQVGMLAEADVLVLPSAAQAAVFSRELALSLQGEGR